MSTTVIKASPFVITINPYREDEVSWEVSSWGETEKRLSGGTVGRRSDVIEDLIDRRVKSQTKRTPAEGDLAVRNAYESLTLPDFMAGARAEAEAYVDRYMEHGGGSYGYPPVA